jgi:hypothetical protein
MAKAKKGSVLRNIAYWAFLVFVAIVIVTMHANGANPWRIFGG